MTLAPFNCTKASDVRSLRLQCLRRKTRRSFSSSCPQNTQLRREMFKWLHGPGRVFRDPLPGSTNYLNAYDKDGQLLRTLLRRRMNQDGEEEEQRENREEDRDDDGEIEVQESNRAMGGGHFQKKPDSIPTETASDLKVFPNNSNFRSSPVLNELSREEIYRRVVGRGEKVKAVSMDLGIEFDRVGAVARLKAVEKQWIEEVMGTFSVQVFTARSLPVSVFDDDYLSV